MTKKLFIVDTISTVRHRYVIEADELEHAYDEVVMVDSGHDDDTFEPFSQKYLGQTIIDGRQINEQEFSKMLDEFSVNKDKLCSHWMGNELIRKVDYSR
jgi:hypothetical protein